MRLKAVTFRAEKHMIAMCGNMMLESGYQRVTPEDLRRHFFARHQVAGLGIAGELGDILAKTARQRVADRDHRDESEAQKEGGLQDVHPDGAAHAAQKDADGDDHGDDGAPEPIRNDRRGGAAGVDKWPGRVPPPMMLMIM